jgi:hypothetical protein
MENINPNIILRKSSTPFEDFELLQAFLEESEPNS